MGKTRILFFHFDLGNGGAEKVLVNLVNNLSPEKYDITVKTLFNFGVNKDSLKPYIKREWVLNMKPFRGVTKLFRFVPAALLHRVMIPEHYDIEIAFLEGLPARIVSACPDKAIRKYAWIHVEITDLRRFFGSFWNLADAYECYRQFNKIAFVSENTRTSFLSKTGWPNLKTGIVHNVLEVEHILEVSKNVVPLQLNPDVVNICSVGRMNKQKGYDRLLNALSRIDGEGITNWHLYLLGQGEELDYLQKLSMQLMLSSKVSFLGYVQPPYPYVAKMDLFVCPSRFEGYSTAVSEAILVNTPVLATQCSGMDEILGSDGGLIVDNSEEGIYSGLKTLLQKPDLLSYYRQKAICRVDVFSKSSAIKEFEEFVYE